MRPHASLPSVVAEVIFKLVALVTQIKSLPWDVALHHFETFAGCKAVTRAEQRAACLQNS